MKNSTLETIAKRYTCRDFSNRKIPDVELEHILAAAAQSPSGMNRQYWHIIALKNRELIDELESEGMRFMSEQSDKTMYERIMKRGGKLFYDAPCMIFVAIKEAYPKGAELIDLGIVAQNISLAATSLGIDNCHCGMAIFPFCGSKAAYFKEKLKFPDGYDCGMAVLLGYAKNPSVPHSPDLSKITVIE